MSDRARALWRSLPPPRQVAAFVVWIAGAVSPAPGIRAAQVPTWSADQITRIGSVDDADQSLTVVTGVLIDSRARIFILQPQDRQVVVFDTSGQRLRVIGRSGEGPGEFDAVSAAGLRADTLYVADNALGRISFFDADGEPLSTLRFVSPGFGTPPAFYLATVPQLLLVDGSGLVRPNVPVSLLASGTGRVPYLRIGQAGEVLDTLVWEELPPPTFEILTDGNRVFAPIPFPTTPLFHLLVDGSGILLVDRPAAADAERTSFRVTKIGIDGDTVFSREYDHEPARLDDGDVDGAVVRIEDRLATRPNAPDRASIERAMRDADLIPAHRPPVTHVASAEDGSIWLKRDVADTDADWLVLGAGGQPIGQIRLAPEQRVMAIRGDILAALEHDSLDVPYIVVYRLRR